MVFWPFRRKGPDYEHELPRLSEQIVESKTHFLKVQTAQRRLPFLFLLESTTLYVVYVAIYLSGFLKSRIYKILLFVIPVVIWLVRRSLSAVLRWRLDRAKTKLDGLVSKRKTLVEDYKKKTNYEKILKLIEDPEHLDEQKESSDRGGRRSQPVPTHEQPGVATSTIKSSVPKTMPPGLVPDSIPIYHASWVDRLLDLAIGEDAQSPTSRYALICTKCNAHNGLAPSGKLADEVPYDCPACGHHNGPASQQLNESDAADDEVMPVGSENLRASSEDGTELLVPSAASSPPSEPEPFDGAVYIAGDSITEDTTSTSS